MLSLDEHDKKQTETHFRVVLKKDFFITTLVTGMERNYAITWRQNCTDFILKQLHIEDTGEERLELVT